VEDEAAAAAADRGGRQQAIKIKGRGRGV